MEPNTQYNMVFGGKYVCKHNLRWILTDYHANVNFKVSYRIYVDVECVYVLYAHHIEICKKLKKYDVRSALRHKQTDI